MSYKILYHPKIKDDIKTLNKKQKDLVSRAIEERLKTEPEKYGKPLRGSPKGRWKLRVGEIRVVFKISNKEILVLGILHRKVVYECISKRLN